MRILLVNPPIYDFAAYDFWLKPLGLLRAGGMLRGLADIELFDFLDRLHPCARSNLQCKSDKWGRGGFIKTRLHKPSEFSYVPRYYHRFGLERDCFKNYLAEEGPFDFVFIQTVMTYWYPGVRENIEDIRSLCAGAKIILGGVYSTICPEHAASLGPDLIVRGDNLEPLWDMMNVRPEQSSLPLWEAYEALDAGVMKITCGCPFKCTYCLVPQSNTPFCARPVESCISELDFLLERKVSDIAFYDDALLYRPEQTLIPFLEYVISRKLKVRFHTPNALHARMLTGGLAELMLEAGFVTFHLGFESSSPQWHGRTGSKVSSEDLARAVSALLAAGASGSNITAYEMLGHPHDNVQRLRDSMEYVNSLGVRITLADFSPIPGTPDGEYCRKWTDIDEPLNHNKTAFPIKMLGAGTVNRFKDLCRSLNGSIS